MRRWPKVNCGAILSARAKAGIFSGAAQGLVTAASRSGHGYFETRLLGVDLKALICAACALGQLETAALVIDIATTELSADVSAAAEIVDRLAE